MDLAPILKHRVQIQEKYVQRDENNYKRPEIWIDFKKLWAEFIPLSVKDLIAAQASQAKTVARLKIRYRDDVNTEMRVIFRGKIYAIDGPPQHDNQSGLMFTVLMLSGGTEKYNPDKAWESLVGSDISDMKNELEVLANETLPTHLGR